MPEKGVIGLISVLTGVVGYLVFGWIGAAGGLLVMALMGAGRMLKQCEGGSRKAIGSWFFPGHWRPKRSASKRNAHLEALLAKAHLLADTFHDAYGARNCCLDIIRQTDKEDPLFIAAYDLFMRTVTTPGIRPLARSEENDSNPSRADARIDPQANADVIAFPFPVSRR